MICPGACQRELESLGVQLRNHIASPNQRPLWQG